MTDVSGGSVALARRLATGVPACDVYASADYLNIDRDAQAGGLADYTVVFAQRPHGARLPRDRSEGAGVPVRRVQPPASIPDVAPDWYQTLLAPGVRIGGAHPFLDPGGYRSHMIFELAQKPLRRA